MSTTATSIELTFDQKTTEKIQGVWEQFTTADIQYQHHPRQSLPHITLAIREKTRSALTSFERVASRLTRVRLSLASIGLFLNPRGLNYPDDSVVLFLSPKPTAALLEAHAVAAKVLRGWNRERWAHYKPERWVPHCTLAEHLVKCDIRRALEICVDNIDWPITGEIRGIRLVNFGAGVLEEIATHRLARPALPGSSRF
jgi:2'-5' RNA ligase